ncbi:MAG: MFS transporter [Glaciimonas sp.]|nr:MFS transporter [Glaciimonas sp.]
MKTLPWRDFLALTVSVAVVGLGLGATLPLTALALDQRGLGNHIVGLMTALGALGILAVVPFVAGWVARLGPRNSMIGAVAVAALSTILMQTSTHLIYWSVLRFIFGAALGVLFTVGEAWVNKLAPDGSRGRVVALYATTFTLFQLIGPALVALLSDRIAWPFAACGALFLLSIPGLALMSNRSHTIEDEPKADWKIVAPRMPVIILGTAFFALFDALALSLLPLFGMRHGISVEQALLSASVMLIGNTTLQFPLGWLADRIGRAHVHMGCGLAACLLLPLMPLAVTLPWLWWTLLYVLGGAAGGIYVLSLVACGERFSGQRLVAATAIINATWGVSGSGGPLLTGALMESIHVNAVVVVLWLGAAVFVASLLWEQRPAFIAKKLTKI